MVIAPRPLLVASMPLPLLASTLEPQIEFCTVTLMLLVDAALLTWARIAS